MSVFMSVLYRKSLAAERSYKSQMLNVNLLILSFFGIEFWIIQTIEHIPYINRAS